ncbi:MAG: hypothetical protein NC412_09595 [Roseburia sp.]|nr:hypothetical protein [Roseburia sp.]MCM1279136.1 hypothetical protein [Robinsoniella sp.]
MDKTTMSVQELSAQMGISLPRFIRPTGNGVTTTTMAMQRLIRNSVQGLSKSCMKIMLKAKLQMSVS